MDIQQHQAYSYQVGNCLTFNHPTYVIRPADKQLFDALKAGEFCYVLGSPQTGKSSLKNRTIKLLEAENITCIALDMTRVNNKILTLEEWYDQIILTLEKSLIFPQYFPDLWWEETRDIPADERLMMFIEEVFLVNNQAKSIVIFIDEINDNSIVNANFSSLGIFIEHCLKERVNNPNFNRLIFALLGTTIPKNLVNVCKNIELENLKIEAITPLLQGLEGIVKQPVKVIEEILYWSGGQPFLTQKICQIVINYLGEKPKEENYNDVGLVADLVKICMIENWESQDHPPHLTTIRNCLLRNIAKSVSHLEIYQQILNHGKLKLPEDSQPIREIKRSKLLRYSATVNVSEAPLKEAAPLTEARRKQNLSKRIKSQRVKSNTIINAKWEIRELLISGLIKINHGFLEVYNPIYAEIFNKKWVKEELAKVAKLHPKIPFNQAKINSNPKTALAQTQLPENPTPTQTNKTNKTNNGLIESKTKKVEKIQQKSQEKIVNQTKPKSNNYQPSRKLSLAGLVIVSVIAITGVAWATKLFKDTQNQLQKAEYKLQEAQSELQEAQAGTKLERKGIYALRQFNFTEIEALLSAMQIGKELKELIGSDRPLQYYPATSPLFALQQILNNIHEKNQIPNIKNMTISPDGQLLATVSNDGIAQILKISGQPIAQLRGHQGQVSQITFAPKDNLLATAADDGTARIWDNLGKQQAELKGHEGQIWKITFSPDSQLLATAGEDSTAKIWNLSGKEIATLKKHDGRILDITFSPDGKRLATAGWDGTARIWNRSGRQLARLRGHRGSVEKVTFSPDGKRLATAGWDGTIRVWWASSGQLLAKLKAPQGGVWNVSFSPDGEKLATAGEDGTTYLWNMSGQLLAKLSGHQGIVTSVSFSPDAQKLATAGEDGRVKVWNNNGKLLNTLKGHQGRVWQVNFSPDGNFLLTVGEDGTGRIWQLQGNPVVEIKGNSSIFGEVIFSPNNQTLATAGVDGTARIWDMSGKPLSRFKGYLGMFRDMSFSPDGQRIATAGDNGPGRIWQISGEELVELAGTEGRTKQITFSPDGQRLATVGEDGVARIWNNSGQSLAELKGHNGLVWDVSFSPDGKYIGTVGEDGIAKIWDGSFQVISELKSPSQRLESIGFSRYDKYVATGESNGIVSIWDFSGKPLAQLKGHVGGIEDLTFSADGQQLATLGEDGTVRVWDILGRQVAQFENAVSLSPDGRYVATLEDNYLQLWQVQGLNDLLKTGCDWLEDYFVTHPQVKADLQVCQPLP
ncbi:MAG: WD40 repeat domain-containing protein [Microcoleaceae cyanobacterium MO_207.B10]|nr:WD40 repeat domain-containing protein [Microcoleaceae cyanobacterium MO_207.B10]